MQDERTPFQFRPMHELTAEGREVDMALPTGEVVTGWLFCGVPGAPRTFWRLGKRGHECIEPIGWRVPPTPDVIADWKAKTQAPADKIATAEVRQLSDGRWQMRVCLDGQEIERFDPVDSFEAAKAMVDDFAAMTIKHGGRELPSRAQ